MAMRVGEGGVGMAVQVRFDENKRADEDVSLYVVRTTSGQTLSGLAMWNYVAYEPQAKRFCARLT